VSMLERACCVPVKKKIYRKALSPNLGGNSTLNRHVMEHNTVYLTSVLS